MLSMHHHYFKIIKNSMNKSTRFIFLTLILIAEKAVAQVPELCVPATHEAYKFAFTNDDKMMFSFGQNELRVWSTEGPYLIKRIPIGGADSLDKVEFFVPSDNKKLIALLGDQIRRLNLQTMEWNSTVWRIAKPRYTGFSKNGKFLYYFVINDTDTEANLFKINVETGVINKLMTLKKEIIENLGADVSVNNDESLLISGSEQGGVLLDLKANKVLRTFKFGQRALFINDAGNMIVNNQIINGNDVKNTLEEVEPRTMKVLRSIKIALKTDDIPDYNGTILISQNNRDKVLYELNERFYTVNLINFTQSKRQQVKFNNEGFKMHQAAIGGEMIVDVKGMSSFQSGDAALSAGGNYVFYPNKMTAFKINDVKKAYLFGIIPYQPFMLSDLSKNNDNKVLAGDRIIHFGIRDITFTQLPKSKFANFISSYRLLSSQKRLFMNDVYFNGDMEFSGPFVYDLKNDTSQIKRLEFPDKEWNVSAMREFDTLNMLVLIGNNRFVTLDSRTLKVKQEVKYGNDFYFEKSPLYQANDNYFCDLSADKTKLIISLIRDEDDSRKSIIACYSLTNKALLWKYESKIPLSNPVYTEGGKKVRFFNEKKECITLDAQTGKILTTSPLIPNASESTFFSTTQRYALNVVYDKESSEGNISNYEVYDVTNKKLVVSLPIQRTPYIGAIFMSNDRYLLTQDEDMKLWDLASGKKVAEIITFHNNKDWILLTPDGRFDGSPDGLKQLYYVKGLEIIPLEQLYEGFYTPGLLKKVFDGEVTDGENIKNIKSPPVVKISVPVAQRNLIVEDENAQTRRFKISTDKMNLTVEATCKEDAVSEIRLFHNGKIVGSGTRNLIVEDDKIEKSKTQTFDIQLIEGDNTFRAVALNTQRTESKPDDIIVTYTTSKASPPGVGGTEGIQLHVVVVGINKYKNPKYSLNYAIADATGFKEAIEKSGSSIFSKVNLTAINDENATKSGIVSALEKIKMTASPKDVFIFYYAGHGVMNDKKEFYLVPHDVTQLYGADDALAQKGLSAKDLQQFSKDIKAQKQLFILDACQSAGALEQVVAARGAAEEKAIAQLARSTGTYWLTASGSAQFASEFTQLGHGTFTYVLLEALSGKADTGDKKITVKEIDGYLQERVPEVTAKYKGTPQYPASYGYGNDFPIGVVKQ